MNVIQIFPVVFSLFVTPLPSVPFVSALPFVPSLCISLITLSRLEQVSLMSYSSAMFTHLFMKSLQCRAQCRGSSVPRGDRVSLLHPPYADPHCPPPVVITLGNYPFVCCASPEKVGAPVHSPSSVSHSARQQPDMGSDLGQYLLSKDILCSFSVVTQCIPYPL